MIKGQYLLAMMFGLALLSGCATSKNYDAKLNSMIGQSTAQLSQELGRPSAKKILPNGTEVWAYTKIDDVYVPSEFYLYNQGAFSNEYGGLYAPFMEQYDFSPYQQNFGYEVQYSCQTAFMIQNNQVIGWSWSGNNCAAGALGSMN